MEHKVLVLHIENSFLMLGYGT